MSTAYQTYLAAGEHMKAIKIVGEKGWTDKLAEIAKLAARIDDPSIAQLRLHTGKRTSEARVTRRSRAWG